MYASMGIFGAALYGQDTKGNIMVNMPNIVRGRLANSLLYVSMALYLCIGAYTKNE